MQVNYRQDDDLLKIIEGGFYIGYVDEVQMLHLFDDDGHAVPIRNVDSRTEIPDILRTLNAGSTLRKTIPAQVKQHTVTVQVDRLVGILMAHLACHEPDAQCIKDARKYLTDKGIKNV